MNTTTTTTKRAEASRRNGARSRGPRTPKGKDRSRFNALKHGMTAQTLVLPGEDPAAFQARLDAWTVDLDPRNDVERTLVERAAILSWQLERADRAEAARLSSLIRAAPAEEALRQADAAAALGQRLFRDPRGPMALYPHALYLGAGRPRASVSATGPGDDPDDPPRLLLRLEASAAGCRWLRDRWADLGALLDQGQSWQSPDKLRAIRLLGRQPLDAADSPVVALIFQACHVLDPQIRHAAGTGTERSEAQTLHQALRVLETVGIGTCSALRDDGEPAAVEPDHDPDLDITGDWDGKEDVEAQIAWQGCGAAFAELRGELTAEEGRAYRSRLEGRRVDQLRPRDPAEARAKLRGIVDQAMTRLQAKLDVHEQWEAAAAVNQTARLSFDASIEGERLRRYQLSCGRAQLRTLGTLLKARQTDPGDGPAAEAGAPEGTTLERESFPAAWPPMGVAAVEPARAGESAESAGDHPQDLVIPPPPTPALLSPCHPLTLSPCHPLTLSPDPAADTRPSVTLSPPHLVTLSPDPTAAVVDPRNRPDEPAAAAQPRPDSHDQPGSTSTSVTRIDETNPRPRQLGHENRRNEPTAAAREVSTPGVPTDPRVGGRTQEDRARGENALN
jgi:hypothetical protein